MPNELTTLLAAQNAAHSYLFWFLLLALVACVVFPERVHRTHAMRKSFIAFLAILGTKAFAALVYGLLALAFSGDVGSNDYGVFLAISAGLSSLAAAASWAAMIYGFWQLYLATSKRETTRNPDPVKTSRRRRQKTTILRPSTDDQPHPDLQGEAPGQA